MGVDHLRFLDELEHTFTRGGLLRYREAEYQRVQDQKKKKKEQRKRKNKGREGTYERT